jgi:DNA topoisomerase-1
MKHLKTYEKFAAQKVYSEKEIEHRWKIKRESIYNLKNNINKLKTQVKKDLSSDIERDQLTALVIRIMLYTSERVGNAESATNGHFGITQLKNKHFTVSGNSVTIKYVGKSNVDHEKTFSDAIVADLITKLKKRNKDFIFITEDGFKISPDRINRYLKNFNAKSKDIRGFNSNKLMVAELKRIGKVKDEKERPKIFNAALKKIGEKIGHLPSTLRKHYLLPEIEESFYKHGSIGRININ